MNPQDLIGMLFGSGALPSRQDQLGMLGDAAANDNVQAARMMEMVLSLLAQLAPTKGFGPERSLAQVEDAAQNDNVQAAQFIDWFDQNARTPIDYSPTNFSGAFPTIRR